MQRRSMPENTACSEGVLCPHFCLTVTCFLRWPGPIFLMSFVRIQGEDLLSRKQRDPVTGEGTGLAFFAISFVWWEAARNTEEELCGYDDLHGHRSPCICKLNLDLISCHAVHATQRLDKGPITANQFVDVGFRQVMRNHDYPCTGYIGCSFQIRPR